MTKCQAVHGKRDELISSYYGAVLGKRRGKNPKKVSGREPSPTTQHTFSISAINNMRFTGHTSNRGSAPKYMHEFFANFISNGILTSAATRSTPSLDLNHNISNEPRKIPSNLQVCTEGKTHYIVNHCSFRLTRNFPIHEHMNVCRTQHKRYSAVTTSLVGKSQSINERTHVLRNTRNILQGD